MAVIGNNNLISMWYRENGGWYNRQSNQWGEIHSDYRITVTPKGVIVNLYLKQLYLIKL